MGRPKKKETGIVVHKDKKVGTNRYGTHRDRINTIGVNSVPENELRCRPWGGKRAGSPDGIVKVSLGFQCYELLEILAEKWQTNRSEVMRRLLLPLCGPTKRAIRTDQDEIEFEHTYSLHPEDYDKYTFR